MRVRVMLLSLLGLLVGFAMTSGTAQAQRRGFSHGNHGMRQSGGSGYGGWVHGSTASFYTFNHNRGGHPASGHRHRGNHRGYQGYRGAVGAFPQPYPYLPFLNYGFTYPLDDSLEFDDNGSYDNGPENPPQPNPAQAAMQMNQAAIANQLQQLHAEVEELKAAQAPAPTPAAPVYQPSESESEPMQPPVTLVLRNGQQLTVNDYAVMDHTFWDFSKRPVYKIPLSSIDIAASQRATAAVGGEFPALSINP